MGKILESRKYKGTPGRRKIFYRAVSSCIMRVVRSKGIRYTGNVACSGDTRHAFRALMVVPKLQQSPERASRRRKHSIKMTLKEIE
jgi:hypothetical protein